LIVAKVHKIKERIAEGKPSRLDDKDALDVLRLLRAVATGELAMLFGSLLRIDLTKEVTQEALTALKDLVSDPGRTGSQMAARAAGPLASKAEIAGSCAALTQDLLAAVNFKNL
jgi:hypothetical protein